MRNFGETSEFNPYSEENVNRGVFGAVVMTTGITGAFVGLATAAIGVGLYEVAADRRLEGGRENLIYLLSAGLFAAGVPAMVYQSKSSGGIA